MFKLKGIDPAVVFWIGVAVTIESAIGHGTVSLTNMIPASWIPYVTSWCNGLAFVGTTLMTALSGISSTASGPLISTPAPSLSSTAKAVIAFFAIMVLSMFLISPASAQQPTRQAPNLNPPCAKPFDIRPACKNGIFAPEVTGGNTSGDPSMPAGNCQFGTFAILTPSNLVQTIQNCGETFLTDSQAALASAKAANDNVATSCLTPGTALIQAGVGTPGTPGTTGDPTATPPVPAVPGVPPKLGGPVLMFQKYREFVNAGGISACEAWVNTVIAATAGAAANGAVGIAGAAAVLSPIK